MSFMHLVMSHALACVAVSLSFDPPVLAQSPSKSQPDRAKVTAADVEAIDKALESTRTSAALLGSSANCTPGWTSTFGPQNGIEGPVWTALQHDDGSGDALYIGGSFRNAGAVEAEGIVRWDGSEFSAVGDYPGLWVRALVTHDDGTGPKLYAAGSDGIVLPSGAYSAGVVACWDGTQWTSLGGAFNGEVHSLAVFDDGSGAKLYAGGNFTTIGGLAATRLARWDGQSWSSIGAAFNDSVLALTAHDDGGGARLYAAGAFTLQGGSPGDHIASFDGAQWSDIGTGDISGPIQALESFDAGGGPALWVGGPFTSASAGLRQLARWSGGVWSPVVQWGGVFNIYALATHDDGGGAKLYAGGIFSFAAGGLQVVNVMRLDNGQWQGLGGGLDAAVHTLTTFDSGTTTSLFAGGRFNLSNPPLGVGDAHLAPRVALWDGLQWSWPASEPQGLTEPLIALGVREGPSGAALLAQGRFPSGPSGAAVLGVAEREPGSWKLLPPISSPGLAFETHDDGSGPRLYAGGTSISSSGVNLGPVARLNGPNWNAVGTPRLNDVVAALKSFDDGSGSALYAGGAFTAAGSTTLRRVARWDGVQWQPLGGGLPTFGAITAFEVHDDGSGPALFAGGTSNGGGAQAAKWDGASWTPLGPSNPTLTAVTALASFDDGSGAQLYAGGLLKTAWGATVNIARWDGQVWSALPGDLDGSPTRLVVHDDGAGEQLYVAGKFRLAGGVPDIQLARFDGANWEVLARGLGGQIMQLVEYDDGCGPALAFAGFSGMEPTSRDGYIARWGCQACGDASVYCTAGSSTAGCVAELTVGGVSSASAPQNFVVVARNVEGNRLGALTYGINGPLSAPFGSSTLCVAPPLQLTRVQSSGASAGSCDGVLAEDWNQFRATNPSALGAPFGVGDTVWAQYWVRDPLAANRLVTSSAVQFTLAP